MTHRAHPGLYLSALIRAFLIFPFFIGSSSAQDLPPTPETVTVEPNRNYHAGGFHRFMMGDGYRELWTTPITVPVLDLETYAGGLTPLRSHTGSQTTSLRFMGADGREYQFRSIDKNPRMVLPEELRKTLVGRVIKDGVSSTHPVGGILAAAVLEAAGVLHVTPELFVMPDSPVLGEFRSTFVGMLGGLEERADENDREEIAFVGAITITGSDKLYERINRSPDHRIDRKAFLKARLVDLFIGDRDRHRDNWRWAQFNVEKPVIWEPISRDHDHAFEKISGLIPLVAANYTAGILNYGPEYGPMDRLTWNGQEVDRRFFAGFEKSVWDSVATDLQHDLTDEALRGVVAKLPPEYLAISGDELFADMQGRRDHLPEAADRFYRFLARKVDIHATDAAEEAVVTLLDDRSVDVRIRERKNGARSYFHRIFHDYETTEIRLRMFGGDDRVVVRGSGNPEILIRIVGDDDRDALIDSTGSGAGNLRFYDLPGGPRITGGHPRKVNRKRYTEWRGSDLDRYPPREWGSITGPVGWLDYDSDYGAFLGGGIRHTNFGFRKAPYASQIVFKAGFTTDPSHIRVAFKGDFRRENSNRYYRLDAVASGIEILHYYGAGNNTSLGGRRKSFFNVEQQQYRIDPAYVVPLSSSVEMILGPTLVYSDAGNNSNRFISVPGTNRYGAGDFGQVGARVAFVHDTRDRRGATSEGVLLKTEGRFFPAVWDVREAFGRAEIVASTYLNRPYPLDPVLALRVGAAKVWGRFPYQESAFVGGSHSLRGWHRQRFAGDASIYVNADLRLALTDFFFVLPGDFGVFGLVDAGRVYLDSASPGGWHTATGGGIWFSFLNRANTFSLGAATNKERTNLFFRAGFDF